MEKSATSYNIPFRLTIAALGPEKVSNAAATEVELKRVFEVIRNSFPTRGRFGGSALRTPVTLAMITSLYQGFETFAARQVKRSYPDTPLKVVLPFSVEVHKKEFLRKEAEDAFTELLGEARHCLPLSRNSEKLDFPPEKKKQAKTHHLRAVGRYIISHCDLLVVLEEENDTDENKKRIEYLVQYAESTGCPIYFLNRSDDAVLNQFAGKKPGHEYFRHFEDFNKGASEFKAEEIESDWQMKDILGGLPRNGPGDFTGTVESTLRENLAPFYICADRLAGRFQSLYRRAGLFNFVLAFAATLTIGAGVTFFHSAPPVFIIESIILLIILSLIIYANKRRSHKNYLEYRVLAEGLRSTLFLTACGVTKEPPFAPRRSEQSISTWMLIAYEEIISGLPKVEPCDQNTCGALGAFICKTWIQGQRQYHEKNYQKYETRSRYMEKTGLAMYAIALVLAISHVAASHLLPGFHELTINNFMILAALLLPSAGAGIEAIRTHREFRRLKDKSKIMAHELKELEEAYFISTPEDLEKFLFRVEQVMLSENQDWALLMAAAELHPAI